MNRIKSWSPIMAWRAEEIFRAQLLQVHKRTDLLFGALMVIQYFAGIAAAILISPYTWHGATKTLHIHVYLAVVLGAVLAAFPLYLVWRFPGHVATRHVIAAAQLMFSGLLVHFTGGRIETHFHVFGSLAFLAYYRDWRVLGTATLVTVIDHLVRGIWWPFSVYGVANAPFWRTLEHGGWVLFADVFFVYASFQSLREMRLVAVQCADLEFTKSGVELKVIQRTHELDESRRAAETANRAKSEFLANMSHELRTPLTAIMGYAELLHESEQDAESIREAADTIHRNSEHLLSLINDVLDLSKVESGKFTLHLERCDLGSLLIDVASTIQARANAKNIAFGIEIASPVPRSINTDATRLRQILINLLGNAVKFTMEGGVRLIVSVLNDPDPVIQCDVIDTGIGISEVDQMGLFMAFNQADTTMARRFGGTGLGLAISKRLAQMLGGDVVIVDSQEGIGTRFRLTVQCAALEDSEMMSSPPLEDRNRYSAAMKKGMVTDLPYRILVAEDGPDNQRLILHILRKAKARTVLAQNGREAVDMALESRTRGTPFDVILMDMQMPEMDGYHATRVLRQEGYTGIIIALTAHAMKGDREKCMNAGCDDFLSKPINRVRFSETIRRHVESRHVAHV